MEIKLVTLATLLIMATPVYASDFIADGLHYNINADGVSVTLTHEGDGYWYMQYPDLDGDVVIPQQIAHNDVTYDVTAIGDSAFFCCFSIKSVFIPNSITHIGKRAFNECPNLDVITVASDNPVYDSREDCNGLIETSTNKLIYGCKTTLIPNSVTAIGDYAFEGCLGLYSITFHKNITSIGSYAFQDCQDLDNIRCKIPDPKKVQVGDDIFKFCEGAAVYIPVGTYDLYTTDFSPFIWSYYFFPFEKLLVASDTLGDLNLDDTVDGSDINIIVGQLINRNPYIDEDGAADLNSDGSVDGSDLNTTINIVLGKE